MKQTLILTSLLGLSLIGSYLTWTSDSAELSEDGVAVYHTNNPNKIDFTSKNTDVIIERVSDNERVHTWIKVTDRKRTKKPKPAEAIVENDAPETEKPSEEELPSAPEAPTEPEFIEEVETTVMEFRGNEASKDLWDAFHPLMAIRALSTDPYNDVLGFEGEKSGDLIINPGSETIKLKLGGETYGSKDRYLRYEGKVFLVDDKHLRSISSAKARLVERRIHPLAEKEITKISLQYGDQTTTLIQNNPDDRAAAYWSRENSSEEDSAAGTWLGKLFRLKVQSYEQNDPALLLTPVFNFTVEDGADTWTTTILKSSEESNPDYYAKNNFNISLVKLTKSIASDAAEDLSSVFNLVEVSP